MKKAQERKIINLVETRTKELKQANINLSRISESKDDVLKVVSHDLRNPIANICGFMKMLLEDDDADKFLNEESRESVEMVYQSGFYMSKLVEDLLDLSIIESGKEKMCPRKFDYISFIKNQILFNEALSKEHNISIELKSELSVVSIMGDDHRITQVLQNLISNAFKFSQAGSKISILLVVENDNIVTTIRDQGCGIESDKFDLIFKRYSQVKSNKAQAEKGVGLGLSIVKAIVEAHQGKIWVKSELGKGTDFIFTLPLVTDL